VVKQLLFGHLVVLEPTLALFLLGLEFLAQLRSVVGWDFRIGSVAS
jgi:hypothetical protein